eukprot:3362436-Ditylum_brightwellii.AAC.1
MDLLLPGGAGNQGKGQHHLSGQPERDEVRKKRKRIKQEENLPYQHLLLLCHQQDSVRRTHRQ